MLARSAGHDDADVLGRAHDGHSRVVGVHDPLALDLAIATYESLLAETTQTAQRLALEQTLKTLRTWRLSRSRATRSARSW